MNPRERLLSAIRGGIVDKNPLKLDCFHYERIDDCWHESFKPIVERIINDMHYYVEWQSHINRYFISPPQFTSEEKRHEDGDIIKTITFNTPKGTLTAIEKETPGIMTTWKLKYPVESLDDIEKIRSIRWEMPEGLEPPVKPDNFEFARRGILKANVSSPFVCAAAMMPYEYFLELCATEYALIDELVSECNERVHKILDVILSNRALDYVWMGGCEWLTPPMGSPLLYDAFVQKYEKNIIERIHDAGAVVHLHCHGNMRSTFEKVIERGADFIEPMEPPPDGDITLAEAKEIAAGRITVGGNIEARILEEMDEAAVEKATREAFEGGNERMILQQSAGPIQPLTNQQVRNYHKMIDVWEELSPCEQRKVLRMEAAVSIAAG